MSVTLYSKKGCPPCRATEKKLTESNIEFTKIDVTVDGEGLQKVRDLGYQGVPVVFVNEEKHWQGYRPDEILVLKDM